MESETNLDSEAKQKKLYFMTEQLGELHSKLNYEVQSRIPFENLSLISNVLLEDPNIFEIIKGLRDCQNATEKILKQQRDERILAHQKEIEDYTRTLSENELGHTVSLARMQHEKQIREIDKSIVQQLDVAVQEQQQTLFALNVPGFYETSDSKIIVSQMHLFSFLLRLQKLLENQS